jgi:translation initiation factor 2A
VNGSNKAAPAPAPAAAPAAPAAPVEPAVDQSAQDKKIRGLLKKIRAIDELKMRLAGGEKLEDTQMKKIQTEDAVRKELEAVGYNG